MKTELQDNYDKYVKDLNSNLDTIVSVVKETTNSINGMLSTVNDTIYQLLKSYGVDGLNNSAVGIPKFASGSRHIGINGYGITQDNGREIVLNNGDVLIPFNTGDKVLANKLTENMFSLAANYDQIVSRQMSNIIVPDLSNLKIRSGGETISPVVQCSIEINNPTSEQDVINAIDKSMSKISKRVQTDIRKDLKKAGW